MEISESGSRGKPAESKGGLKLGRKKTEHDDN
jgi:hypothetical protein